MRKPRSARLTSTQWNPWAANLWWRYNANRGQVEGCVGLGQATKCQRYPVIHGLHQLLQKIRQELCRHGRSIDGFDTEDCAVAMGAISATSLSAVEGYVMLCASVVVSRPPTTIYSGCKRIRVSYQRRTDVGPGEWTTTSSVS